MQVLFDIPNFSCIMQLRAENQNLVSALSNYQQILYQFFDFTQNLKQSHALRYSLSRRNFFFYTSTAKVTKIYFLSFSNLELFVCAPVLSHESSFLLLKRHLSQVYCHGRGKSFKKKLCVSWALSLVECVAVWALKLPVPHTDAFKTHSSQSFFLNY